MGKGFAMNSCFISPLKRGGRRPGCVAVRVMGSNSHTPRASRFPSPEGKTAANRCAIGFYFPATSNLSSKKSYIICGGRSNSAGYIFLSTGVS